MVRSKPHKSTRTWSCFAGSVVVLSFAACSPHPVVSHLPGPAVTQYRHCNLVSPLPADTAVLSVRSSVLPVDQELLNGRALLVIGRDLDTLISVQPTLDGTPLQWRLKAGDYRVRLYQEPFRTVEARVALSPNCETNVHLILRGEMLSER